MSADKVASPSGFSRRPGLGITISACQLCRQPAGGKQCTPLLQSIHPLQYGTKAFLIPHAGESFVSARLGNSSHGGQRPLTPVHQSRGAVRMPHTWATCRPIQSNALKLQIQIKVALSLRYGNKARVRHAALQPPGSISWKGATALHFTCRHSEYGDRYRPWWREIWLLRPAPVKDSCCLFVLH